VGPDPIVTFGESHTTDLNGDALQSALKMEEGEISYLNEVLKAVPGDTNGLRRIREKRRATVKGLVPWHLRGG
jgi:hypothetical protein